MGIKVNFLLIASNGFTKHGRGGGWNFIALIKKMGNKWE